MLYVRTLMVDDGNNLVFSRYLPHDLRVLNARTLMVDDGGNPMTKQGKFEVVELRISGEQMLLTDRQEGLQLYLDTIKQQ